MFKHGDRVKRQTNVPSLYVYGIYLGSFLDINGQELCICINPDVNEYAYFMARPYQLSPLAPEEPSGKRQPPLINSKY